MNGNSHEEYKELMKGIHIEKRKKEEKDKQEYKERIHRINKEYNIPPKCSAYPKEVYEMIGMVLESGETGTQVIKKYAEIYNKGEKWIKEVAKQSSKKMFSKQLKRHEEDSKVIERLKEKKIYNSRAAINNTLTGFLRTLSQQVRQLHTLDEEINKVEQLKALLSLKEAHSGAQRNSSVPTGRRADNSSNRRYYGG